ncbi:MAG: phosphoglucosamine mutase [Candidatus Aminicenantes bacterium]|nr:phosphoglucosamine mutase [Candidatus Aminicenantes bacterium]
MSRLFGTDGLRAVAGEFPLNEGSVIILGQALANLLKEKGLPPRVVMGRDTRESGRWLEEFFWKGLSSAGGEAVSAGVITTPAISYLTRTHNFSAGIVISASHNPYYDNGIKIFSSSGTKISESWEIELEKAILEGKKAEKQFSRKLPLKIDHSLSQDYLNFLKGIFPEGNKKKFKLIVDCANGASYYLAPHLFRSLGFEVVAINDKPDGKNINLNCGSLYPEGLVAEVRRQGADLGIAYDGDADRAIWVDEKGCILNGDHTLYLQAIQMKEKKLLKKNAVVATIMSNLGLEKILADNGLKLIRTKVGDKYVLDEMIKRDINLGGEQSGHTIFLDHSIAGDGLLTSLKMLAVRLEKGKPFSELVKDFQEFPQILINVKIKEKIPLEEIPGYNETIEEIKEKLGDEGRVEVRYSGTEPVVRIMVEGQNKKSIKEMAEKIAKIIKKR